MKNNDDFDYEITDYDSQTDTCEMNFHLTEEEYNDIKVDYEKYLKTKENSNEAVSIEEFFEIALNIGLYTKKLEIKKQYLKLLKREIEDLENAIDDYQLKL